MIKILYNQCKYKYLPKIMILIGTKPIKRRGKSYILHNSIFLFELQSIMQIHAVTNVIVYLILPDPSVGFQQVTKGLQEMRLKIFGDSERKVKNWRSIVFNTFYFLGLSLKQPRPSFSVMLAAVRVSIGVDMDWKRIVLFYRKLLHKFV